MQEPGVSDAASSTEPGRLRSLIDAGIALNSELSLDALLQRLVEIASLVHQVRSAARNVLDQIAQLAGLTGGLVVQVDHMGDLGQRETQPLPAQNQLQTDPVPIVEDAALAVPFGGEQAAVLVVADRAQGRVELAGQLADAPRTRRHVRNFTG